MPDTWKAGLNQLPYPKEIRASFKKFRDEVMKINVRERMAELDAQPFSNFTATYAPEVRQWWDSFGPSNWGASTELSSAFVGLSNVQDLVRGGDGKRVILPGGLGCITHKLVEVLRPKYKDRMLDNTAVVAVAQEEDSVRVTYFRDGKITTVAAKLVLMCAPMLIASRIVMGLPAEQKAAMRRYRYAPYPVVNLIFDKPVYNRGYDTCAPEIPSPISSSPTGPFATLPATSKNTTFSPSTPRSAPNSALPCSLKKPANPLPPASSLIFRSCARSSM